MNEVTINNIQLLHLAIEQHNIKNTRRLLEEENIDPNQCQINCFTTLFSDTVKSPVEENITEITRLLLNHHCEIPDSLDLTLAKPISPRIPGSPKDPVSGNNSPRTTHCDPTRVAAWKQNNPSSFGSKIEIKTTASPIFRSSDPDRDTRLARKRTYNEAKKLILSKKTGNTTKITNTPRP